MHNGLGPMLGQAAVDSSSTPEGSNLTSTPVPSDPARAAHEAAWDALVHFWGSLPPWLQALVTAVAAALIAYKILRPYGAAAREALEDFAAWLGRAADWRNKRASVAAVNAAVHRPDAPELEPNCPEFHFTVSQPGILEEAEYFAKTLRAGGRGVRVVKMKAVDSPEGYFLQCLSHAGATRGLKFLPVRVRYPIQLYITREHLTKANAPPEALDEVERRLRGLYDGPFYAALFSPASLHQADYSADRSGPNYFKKFFQPLLVSFCDNDFVETAGTVVLEEEALIEHVRYLCDNRVVAIRLESDDDSVDETAFFAALPDEIPSGVARRAVRRAKLRENLREKAQAVLIVASPEARARAQSLEMKLTSHLDGGRTRVSFSYWAPDIQNLPNPACWLWQRHDPPRETATEEAAEA